MNLGWKSRVGVVLSAVWLCLVFLVADDYRRLSQVLGLGLLPLMVTWGIVWAVAGWRSQRPEKPATQEAALAEAKANRTRRTRTALGALAVLGLGITASVIQFRTTNMPTMEHLIGYWAGQWLLLGLIVYAILRLVPRLPAGAPAVLTAVISVGALNYQTYSAISEERQALDSLAKAAPLLNKIQAGNDVSDQEVKEAHIGMLEPLVIAQATFNREVLAISATFQRVGSELQPELMLTPTSLASPSTRSHTRVKLKMWQQATEDYKSQIEAAMARGRLGVQAAMSQVPSGVASGASKGFDESAMRLATLMTTIVAADRDARQAAAGLLDLMDANTSGYVLDKGPPERLLFHNQATLSKHKELIGDLLAASQRQHEGLTRYRQAQAAKTSEVESLLKR